MKKHLLLAVVALLSTRALAAQIPNWIKNPANGHYYALTLNSQQWAYAQRTARTLGANLATVRNKSENDWLAKTFPNSNYWIGLTDVAKEGTFVWATGEPLGAYSNWAAGEPNNGGNIPNTTPEHYVLILSSGEWSDRAHNGTAYGIMERIDPEFFTFGKGCASTTVPPTISSTTPPSLGQNFTLTVTGFLPKLQFGQLIMGGSNTHWGIIPLPMSLSIIGASNCSLHVSMDTPLLIATDAQGNFKTTLKVPALPASLGATIYGQAWAPDPKSNPVGIATTNGFKVRIGR